MIGDISLRVLTYDYCALGSLLYTKLAHEMRCESNKGTFTFDNLGEDKSYRNTNGL